MDFGTFVEAAIKLGILPAVALFLIVSMHLQNRQMLRDRKDIETQLLQTMGQIMAEYQRLLRILGPKLNQRHPPREFSDED